MRIGFHIQYTRCIFSARHFGGVLQGCRVHTDPSLMHYHLGPLVLAWKAHRPGVAGPTLVTCLLGSACASGHPPSETPSQRFRTPIRDHPSAIFLVNPTTFLSPGDGHNYSLCSFLLATTCEPICLWYFPPDRTLAFSGAPSAQVTFFPSFFLLRCVTLPTGPSLLLRLLTLLSPRRTAASHSVVLTPLTHLRPANPSTTTTPARRPHPTLPLSFRASL